MKFLLFLLVLGGIGAGGWWYFQQQQLQHAAPKKPVLAKIDQGDVTEKVSATGKVIPREKILVSSDVPLGIVNQVNPDAEPGKFIKAGTWLLRLDDSIALARLKEAEAGVDTAKAARAAAVSTKEKALVGVELARLRASSARKELESKKQQVGENNIPPGQLESYLEKIKEASQGERFAEAQVSEAEAAIKTADANILRAGAGVELAKKGVDMMTIVAKRDGVVLEKKVIVGQPVSPQNSPLLIMAPSSNDWEVYAMVSESDIAKVQEGQPVEFGSDAYAGKNVRFKGTVLKKDRVPSQLMASTPIGLGLAGPTNYGVTITVQHNDALDKDFPLLSGMTANVDILVNSVKNKLRLPKAATQYQPGAVSKEDRDRIDASAQDQWMPLWVWTKAERAELVFIKTGVDDGAFVEIREVQSGPNAIQLQAGTEVVIEDPPQETRSGSLFGGDKPMNISIR